jgi:branched-chain amino acid transport system substrate-binding protein
MRKLFVLSCILAVVLAAGVFAEGSQEEGPIKIGMYADLSAGTAQWGQDAERGGKLRVKEVNEAGGLLGREVELIVYDIKMSPTEGVQAYTRLVQQDGVVAVQGSLISNTALAVSPVAAEMGVPVVARAMDERATTPGFDPENPEQDLDPNPYFFLTQPSAFEQSRIIAHYAVNELGLDTFAMLYSPGNSYSLYLARGFEHYLNKWGKEMLGGFEFQAGDTDYKTQLTKIKQLNPDGLYICNYLQQNANAVKQAAELGLDTTYLGNNSWYKPMDEVAGEAADGGYFVFSASPEDPAEDFQEFRDNYMEEYGQEARQHSYSGYDDVGFIIDAIRRAGSTDPEAIRDAMKATDSFDGILGTIDIDPETHRPIDLPLAILYYDGAEIKTAEVRYVP